MKKQTIREILEEQLVNHGLWPVQARTILDNLIADPEYAHMEKRWDEYVGDYPPMFTQVLWLPTKRQALKWIDANKPHHWAREMFVD